jgi:hypothetical protein
MAIPPQTQLDDEHRRQLAVSLLTAAGPLLWFTDLVAMYAVSNHECGAPLATGSLCLGVVAVLGTTAALYATATLKKRLASAPVRHDRSYTFLLQLSFWLNALALVLLLGFAAPLLALRPCE